MESRIIQIMVQSSKDVRWGRLVGIVGSVWDGLYPRGYNIYEGYNDSKRDMWTLEGTS